MRHTIYVGLREDKRRLISAKNSRQFDEVVASTRGAQRRGWAGLRFLAILFMGDGERRGTGLLTSLEQRVNIRAMVDRDRLAFYPFVVVRIACRVCSRSGSYRLARLAAKYGPEITLRDLTERFSYDCLWRAEARSKAGKSACGVYLPDLANPRPPDLPAGLVKLRLIKSD